MAEYRVLKYLMLSFVEYFLNKLRSFKVVICQPRTFYVLHKLLHTLIRITFYGMCSAIPTCLMYFPKHVTTNVFCLLPNTDFISGSLLPFLSCLAEWKACTLALQTNSLKHSIVYWFTNSTLVLAIPQIPAFLVATTTCTSLQLHVLCTHFALQNMC